MYVPVSELKTAGRRKGRRARTGAGGPYRLRMLSCAFWLAFGLSGPAGAQVTPAAGAATTTHTSANGVPVINIAAPDAHGLSHNKFQQFNIVAPGAVFNNSKQNGRSQIAGQISRNPNLTGALASTILSEVTGPGASSLNGTLEVHGGTANLIIANPNGISVDGLTTLNTHSLTLSTGVPSVRDGVVSLGVTQGQLTVGSSGVNTDGLQTFDMVAKLIQIGGAIGGTQGNQADIKALAGSSNFITATRSAAPVRRKRAAEAGSGYAIDGSAAGAMHGKAITLISTDAGLGVRQPGTLVSAGDISIDARGNVEVGSAKARDLALRAGADVKAGTVQTAGKLTASAGRNLAVDTMVAGQGASITTDSGDITLGPAGKAESAASELTGNVELTARNGSIILSRDIKADSFKVRARSWVFRNAVVEASGKSGAPNSVDVEVSDRIVLVGALHGVDGAGNPITNSVVKMVDGRPVVHEASSGKALPDATVGSSVGVRALKGNILLKGSSLDNQSSVITALDGDTTLSFTGNIENQGVIQSKKRLTVTAKDIKNTLLFDSDTNIELTASGKIENTGEISSLDKINKRAVRNVLLHAGEKLTNSGFLGASGKLTIEGNVAQDGAKTRPDVINDAQGRVDVEELSLTGNRFDNKGSFVVRGSGATADVTQMFRTTGSFEVSSQNGLDVRAGDVYADGKLTVKGRAKLDARANAQFAANAKVQVNTLEVKAQDLINKGDVTSTGQVNVQAQQSIVNHGKLQGHEITLAAQRDVRNEGVAVLIQARQALSVTTTGSVTNGGTLRGRTVTLQTDEAANERGAMIVASQSGDFKVRKSLRNEGTISTKRTDIQAAELHNMAGGSLSATSAKITVSQGLTNSGEIKVSGMLDGRAATLSNQAGAQLSAAQAKLNVQGDLSNAGDIKTQQLTLAAKGLHNQPGALLQADSAQLTVQEDIDNAGEVKAKKLTLGARKLHNKATGKIQADNATLRVQSLDNAGVAQASHDMSIMTTDYANAGQLRAGHDLTLNSSNIAGLTIDAKRQSPLANGTLTLQAKYLTVRTGIENPGNVVLTASTGGITNYSQIATPGALTLTAKGGITNSPGSLIWAGKDVTASGHTIDNQRDAWLMSQNGKVTLAASQKLRNEAGRIEAGGKLSIDTPNLENLSELQGDVRVQRSQKETVNISQDQGFWSTGRWVRTKIHSFSVSTPVSTLKVKQGGIRAGGDIDINQQQHKGKKARVYNEGAIVAGAQLRVDGNVENRSKGKSLSVMDYLRQNTGGFSTRVEEVALPSGGHDGRFTSLYDMLDFMLNNSAHRVSLGGFYSYSPTYNLFPVLAGADLSKAPELQKMLAAALGADWRGLTAVQREERWREFKNGRRGGTVDYYPLEQTVLAGKAGVTHTGGTMLVGGNSTQNAAAASLQAHQRQQAQIGKVQVPILAGTLDATFKLDEPQLEDIDLDFPDPVLDELLANRFVFRPVSPTISTAAIKAPGKQTLPRPYFETRLNYIDQSQFYGSGYFFQKLGYQPQQGARVSGDNYFDTQWILRERARLLGAAGARMGSGDAQTVKQLMDNGSEQASRLGLQVGQALSADQVAKLDKDTVWYVWTRINGTQVLMPRVYLARASRQAADDVRKQGGAVVASAGDINVDTGGGDVTVANGALVGAKVSIDTRSAVAKQEAAQRDAMLARLGQELGTPLNSAIDTLAQAHQTQLQQAAGKVMALAGAALAKAPDGKVTLDVSKLDTTQLARLQSSAQDFYWNSQLNATDLLELGRASVGLDASGTSVAAGGLNADAARGMLAERAGAWRQKHDKGQALTHKQLLDVLQRVSEASTGKLAVTKPTAAAVTKAAQRLAESEMRAKGSYAIKAAIGQANFSSTGGVRAGISGQESVTVRAGDSQIAGAQLQGKTVDLQTEGRLRTIVGMRYDEKGHLLARDDQSQIQGSDSVKIAATDYASEGGIVASAGEVALKTSTIKLGTVKEVGSHYASHVTHALGEALAALSQTIKTEQSASATDVGSTITAKKLIVDNSGDVSVTGGTIDANKSEIDIGGNLQLKAGENHYYGYSREDRRELALGAAVGAGGYEAAASLGSETGGSAHAGRGKTAGARLTAGFSASSEESTIQAKTHRNAQFNVGEGKVNVRGTADLGGADINRDLAKSQAAVGAAGLSIEAGNIASTKAVDDIHTQTSYTRYTLGAEANAGSSVATTATRFGDMIAQTVDDPKRKIDPALAAAMAATETTQLLLGDTGSLTGTAKAGAEWGHQTSTETRESTQTFGGNISLAANKGDITLAGTQFKGGDRVTLDAKGDVSLRAAQSRTVSHGEDHGLTLSASINGGVNAALGAAGAGVSATLSGSHTVSTENSTRYQNANIAAGEVSIRTAGDLALSGARITVQDKAKIDVGGNTRITSVQDDIQRKQEGGTWTAGAVAGVNTKTIGSASVTVGLTGEEHHDNAKVVREQAGIQAGKSLTLTSGGNLDVTGAHLVSADGRVNAGGKINASQLKDKIDKDGGKAGGSGAINPTTGLPMVTIEYGRDARDHVEATNNATIAVGKASHVAAAQGIAGHLNTDVGQQRVVTREEYYAGGESALSVALKPAVEKLRDKLNKQDVVEHAPPVVKTKVVNTQTATITPPRDVHHAKVVDPGHPAPVVKTKVIKTETATVSSTPKVQYAQRVDPGHPAPMVKAKVIKTETATVTTTPKVQYAQRVDPGHPAPVVKTKVVKTETATVTTTPKVQYAQRVDPGHPAPVVKTKVIKTEKATLTTTPKVQHAKVVNPEPEVPAVSTPVSQPPKLVAPPVADQVDAGPKPAPKVDPKPKAKAAAARPNIKPQPQGGRYAVQEQVKVAQKQVSEINLMKDVGGKLAKPVTLTFTGPNGPETVTITRREQLMKLDGKLLTSKPAQGAEQKFLLKVEDVGGKNYRISYRTAK
ncbi:filamentous hemagglutinin family N-terminal domain protein [Bordetella holmesii 1058]|uniref:Filamentous hemagglutinin family N-terminal domain protein n=2 Tax=Bordetella holmesii TaxID=35814 RepID=A0ABP3BHA6_9BORD|nr:filamentous hemagglutinin family N-terminal domain protein [Bordetella holmesii 1058]